jgi:inner membrane protein
MHELLASKWFWWALAFALFAVEAVLPGVYMLWLGLAALATAVVVLVGPAMSVPAQWILFSVLSVAAVAAAWRFRGARAPVQNDHPLLNRRGEQLLDRVFPLESGIIDGRGRVKIGDAFWAVEGPELPAGARVRIRAVEGALLRVDPA